MKNKKKKIIIGCLAAAVVVIIILVLANSAYIHRQIKSAFSDIGGGIDRTVTVYDYNGDEIRSWTGKFDVSVSSDRAYFDTEGGKRVIIQGGIIIFEEN